MQSLGKIKRMVRKKFLTAGHKDRYKHTLGVVKMAKRLAKQYDVDVYKAMLAGYLHDYCKYDTEEDLADLIQEKDYYECERFPVLKHSYASAEFYKREIGADEEVYQAIRNHVFGRLEMSRLEEIILISDYTEVNRTYPSCIHCRLVLVSMGIEKAIWESTRLTIEFLKKRNIEPHPLQVEVGKYYERLCYGGFR